MNRLLLNIILISVFIPGFAMNDPETEPIPLYDNLSKYHRKVTTRSQEAQRYFDQGFTLLYGFNHEAAIKSFRQAIALDSSCAMAWWGHAIAVGPNINNPQMDSLAKASAWETIQRAQSYVSQASPPERMLIRALAQRYAWPAPENRAALDSAYALAMREVYLSYPDDPDIATLYADALMNLSPWDYWTSDGKPKAGTTEIVRVLEHTIAAEPNHPGACHFYIHAMEASATPERALAAADSLRYRVPGAGHLVHMPSHIDIRLGHYTEAMKANQRAIIADSVWVQSGGFYTMYRAHNYHFLAYAAMFNGQKDIANEAALGMISQVPIEVVREYPDFLEGFYAVPTHVMVRFGMWDDLIRQPKPPEDLYLTTAFWHYGRVVAFSALGKVKDAKAEFELLKKAYAMIPDSRMVGNNPGKTVLDIGMFMAEGELEYRKGNYTKAFDLLGKAVEKDDSLRYDEPWGWMMPVRHALGALLVEQGEYAVAEEVYQKDLELHPGNGWALKGLADCYHQTGRIEEAIQADDQFRKAWSSSDITLKASCFCSKGTRK